MEKFPIKDEAVAAAFEVFPPQVRPQLLALRCLILTIGHRVDPIGKVTESLKWGEPSYSTICGSPVRIGWKDNRPSELALYFHCQSKLVSTFRALYPNILSFDGNRAIVLRIKAPLPHKELQHCIELAFNYHRIKKLPHLGTQA
ncbi:DUF1801 domain-containing protein [Pelagicoccus sp. SDUM812002]|uniref:DUF1801 domain-containing protein n=1 Tax=Pelagicoccus sp. SDUM812002 TaxID=3041266 RepID=UPI00280DBFDD|nr:DUF1801 domain-containing protein [Pelagicoccus sp. SDUM812002]MDQ8188030.1 DUF1801 domain-containing protein [Pelagicoccus sp. SDUM812002]